MKTILNIVVEVWREEAAGRAAEGPHVRGRGAAAVELVVLRAALVQAPCEQPPCASMSPSQNRPQVWGTLQSGALIARRPMAVGGAT